MRAIRLNALAFRLGRLAAANRDAIDALLPSRHVGSLPGRDTSSQSLDETVAQRFTFLTAYQDARYAKAYLDFVDQARAREKSVMGEEGKLS